jgi:hypothetical protein
MSYADALWNQLCAESNRSKVLVAGDGRSAIRVVSWLAVCRRPARAKGLESDGQDEQVVLTGQAIVGEAIPEGSRYGRQGTKCISDVISNRATTSVRGTARGIGHSSRTVGSPSRASCASEPSIADDRGACQIAHHRKGNAMSL